MRVKKQSSTFQNAAGRSLNSDLLNLTPSTKRELCTVRRTEIGIHSVDARAASLRSLLPRRTSEDRDQADPLLDTLFLADTTK